MPSALRSKRSWPMKIIRRTFSYSKLNMKRRQIGFLRKSDVISLKLKAYSE